MKTKYISYYAIEVKQLKQAPMALGWLSSGHPSRSTLPILLSATSTGRLTSVPHVHKLGYALSSPVV